MSRHVRAERARSLKGSRNLVLDHFDQLDLTMTLASDCDQVKISTLGSNGLKIQ
jgi:hypothetical protein